MTALVHPRELSFEEGIYAVKLARKAIKEKLVNDVMITIPPDAPLIFKRPGMVFTTIETYHGEKRTELRGCIGFLAPIYPLAEAIIRSAIEAAINDPRFPPMTSEELDHVVIEVTVLSEPLPFDIKDRRELPKHIIIGKYGLVVEKAWFRGTLLPMVPVEYCWDEETFLAETCIKAGLEPDCWLDDSTRVYYYEGRAFKELRPGGEIIERDLNREYIELCKKDSNTGR